MLAKLKLWAMLGLSFIAAVFYGLWKRDKAKFAEYREKQAQNIIKAERDARTDDQEGKKIEEKDRNKDVDYLE